MNEFAKTVCAAVFICVIFENISPNGKYEKIYKYIISVFFLLSVLTCAKEVINQDFSFEKIENNSPMSFTSLDDEIVKSAKQNVENLAITVLKKEEIEFKKVDAKMDITESGSINIDRIIVYISSYEKALKTKYALEEELNIKTEVIINEG